MDEYDDEYFERGQPVTHKLTGWYGIVIGERDRGRLYDVLFCHPQQNGGLPFNLCVDSCVIEGIDTGEPESGGGITADNVVQVDFTRKVKLTKRTKTQGAA